MLFECTRFFKASKRHKKSIVFQYCYSRKWLISGRCGGGGGGGGGRGAYKVMCFFGLQVDGRITERVYKREEKEKLLTGS